MARRSRGAQAVLLADLEKANEDRKLAETKAGELKKKLDKEEKDLKKLREKEVKWEEERSALLEGRSEVEAAKAAKDEFERIKRELELELEAKKEEIEKLKGKSLSRFLRRRRCEGI
jgi:hypothetical protein